MSYEIIRAGRFIDRPNRFIAHVEVDGKAETVHVKNTGRCRELLIPGAGVHILAMDCRVTPDSMVLGSPVPVEL